MRAVFLTGFMGVGKTSVGQRVAQRLSWRFIDLDEVIASRVGKTIREMFQESGETAFRNAEFEGLSSLISDLNSNAVIALGGGAYVQPRNFQLIKTSGHRAIHLDADLDELLERCRKQGNDRPLLADENQFRQLYEQRRDGYMKADLHIQTSGKTEEEVAAEIIRNLGLEVK